MKFPPYILVFKLLTLPILFLLAGSFAAATEKVPVCGKLISYKGQIEVLRLRPKKKQSDEDIRVGIVAKKRLKLACYDIVLTGRASRAKVKLKSTLVTLAPNSRLVMSEYDAKTREPNLLDLTYGKIRTLVKKKRQGDEKSFSIKTPSAVMGVRGTDFFVSFDPNTKSTEQATISGSVEVEQKVSGQKVLVEKGMQVKIETVPPVAKEDALDKDSKIKNDTLKVDPTQIANETPPAIIKPAFKPLTVKPISDTVVAQIKYASYIAKEDKDFQSEAAVKLLGKAADWETPKDELPLDLRDIKNEF